MTIETPLGRVTASKEFFRSAGIYPNDSARIRTLKGGRLAPFDFHEDDYDDDDFEVNEEPEQEPLPVPKLFFNKNMNTKKRTKTVKSNTNEQSYLPVPDFIG